MSLENCPKERDISNWTVFKEATSSERMERARGAEEIDFVSPGIVLHQTREARTGNDLGKMITRIEIGATRWGDH